ncbi:MAG: hypothetical protein B7Z08_07325 [Sphingomonadales bacterium 32-68-7]|nr:MAG: hypothetical protein B7Z33_03465 [Sphingomonadales bacterium 12-68-11]OYX08955.1 MAG: hypothetical protein B7Z08_07325 [Sphingomonadales bacterium 32-68-7]
MPEFAQLLQGYRRFKANAYPQQRARFDALAEGQAPPVMVISCCDSRVDPATIFDVEPGQVFALRNVANLVPPFEPGGGLHGASAAIEFAVRHLRVRHVVVMGHGRCGGIHASLEGPGLSGYDFVDDWMRILDRAKAEVLAAGPVDPQQALEWAGIKCSLGNLMTFPFVAERVARGELTLHGMWFAITAGQLYVLDTETGEFGPA